MLPLSKNFREKFMSVEKLMQHTSKNTEKDNWKQHLTK